MSVLQFAIKDVNNLHKEKLAVKQAFISDDVDVTCLGSLARYIQSQELKHLTEKQTALFTSQILEGLDYLHRHKIIHRDIKASNILMKTDFEVQISDFGVAKILNTFSKSHTKGTGTCHWMAPEILQEVPYDSKVDIWSLGCTVYQMITGKQPFSELTEQQMIVRALKNELQLSSPEQISLKLKDILRLMCMKNPTERPNASELMNHTFITGKN
ncbi:serine/threonine-protein kinase cst-1-like [Physella acuta]|uniref:serine/threonine-protein kinase cst-1-like n=1 Tax=Physella acuta TaxID=109671 RepID=UPI0027DE920D|nr:serine/threonine-protein kinase cst-1-like [Physella acuta]